MGSTTVTVLFTDLVASTQLMSRVGESVAEALRREHFGLLRTAIADSGGREVKNLGDGLMVVFDGVTAALACAVAMQQGIDGRPPNVEPLAIRVGVAVGEADAEDGDYFGLPVVEAARLCAHAQGGQILTTDFVRMLARSRGDFQFESIGAVELKGLPEAVDVHRVLWTPRALAEPVASPFPSRLAMAESGTFVGRSTEFDQLLAAWKAAENDGERRIVMLAGEPGIGKTTLSARVARAVHEQGGIVVYGRCDEDLQIPYQPWLEALGEVVDLQPDELVAAHVADRGAHAARLVPRLAARAGAEVPAAGDGDTERFVLFGCVTDLLARASVALPILIVLDDLHWADRATIQLLRHVARASEAMRVVIIGTFRDSDITADHPLTELLAALHREHGAERITLPGLSDDDLLALLETIAGHEMDVQGVALRDALLAETAGNPFFTREILRHLAESGAIYQRDGRWVADADLRAVGLPVSVREVVGRRLATLGADTERVLALAAVIGRDFDIGLLAAVARIDEDAVIDLCDAAVDAAVLRTTDRADRYTFSHALIEHALYDGLSPARRARAHSAVAEALEATLGDQPRERVGELAYHWNAAVQPTDSTKAVRYAQLAGDRALEQLAPDDAVRWYSQALEQCDRSSTFDPRQRVELLVGLGDAQRQVGIAAYRETLLEAAQAAEKIDAVDLLVRAVLANNRGWISVVGGVDHERIAAIDRALARVGGEPSAERAQLLALSATERNYAAPLDVRVALAEDSLAVARSTGDHGAVLWALVRPTSSTEHASTLDLGRAWAREAVELSTALGDTAAEFWARTNLVTDAVERADGAEIAAQSLRVQAVADRIPHASIRWANLFHRAWLTGLRGDAVEYERRAEAAFTFGAEHGEPDAFRIYGAQLVNSRYHQGCLHELVELIEGAIEDTPALHVYRAVLAHANARAGALDAAAAIVEEERAAGFPMPDDQAWSTGHAELVHAVTLLGQSDDTLRTRLLPYHAQIATTTVTFLPSVAHHLGLLDHRAGRLDDAEHWFTEALELHERVGSPVLVAQTQAAQAALLADRNRGDDGARAREMADAALATAIAGGYGYIAADARAVLERLV